MSIEIRLSADGNYQLWHVGRMLWSGITHADAVAVRDRLARLN